MTYRTCFNGMTLRVLEISEFGQLVAVFVGRHVPQGKGWTDHVAPLSRHRPDVLNNLIVQSAFL